MSEVLARVLDTADSGVGGGSAAALAGAMAAGLAGLVARLSSGRDCGLDDARYAEILAECEVLARELGDGAREDAEAYGLVAAAYRLSRDGAGAEARAAAIGEALIAAAEAPLRNAGRTLRVRELCAELEGRSNATAASDLVIAALLADAGVRGCLMNVGVNTCMLGGSPAAARLNGEADAVRATHERLTTLKEAT